MAAPLPGLFPCSPRPGEELREVLLGSGHSWGAWGWTWELSREEAACCLLVRARPQGP